MIPKILHYCWFGKGKKPFLLQQCEKSWKKYCKDWEIIEWNEDNFDISTAPEYVKQAYSHKAYAFVSDYVRLFALSKWGGVYVDTDLELIKPIDVLLSNEVFLGFESIDWVGCGIIGATPQNEFIVGILDDYKHASYCKDGSIDETTIVVRITYALLKHGLVLNNEYQVTDNMCVIYPSDYFSPLFSNKGNGKTINTFSFHYYTGLWHGEVHSNSILFNVNYLSRKSEILTRIRLKIVQRLRR